MAPTSDADGETDAEEISVYVEETRVLLARANAWLAMVEGADAPAPDIDAALRIFHTLKGTAGFFYFTKSRVLAHAAEELLVQVRDQGQALSAARKAALQATVQSLAALNENIASRGDEEGVDTSASWAQLHRWTTRGNSSSEASSREEPWQANEVAVAAGAPQDARPRAPIGPRRVGPLFRQLARFASELAADAGKSVDVQLDFSDQNLSGEFLVVLRQCLVHLLQNAVAHGLEPPAARQQVGKSVQGLLQLRMAVRTFEGAEPSTWTFQLVDDGPGVDLGKLRQRVVERGWVTAGDARAATDEEALQWIWRPGVSTANRVSEASGRGVGLDFVWATTKGMGGWATVTSVAGQGTCFELHFPASLVVVE